MYGVDLLKTRFACERSLPGGLFKKTLKTGMSAPPAGGVIGAFAAHFLLPACILNAKVKCYLDGSVLTIDSRMHLGRLL